MPSSPTMVSAQPGKWLERCDCSIFWFFRTSAQAVSHVCGKRAVVEQIGRRSAQARLCGIQDRLPHSETAIYNTAARPFFAIKFRTMMHSAMTMNRVASVAVINARRSHACPSCRQFLFSAIFCA